MLPGYGDHHVSESEAFDPYCFEVPYLHSGGALFLSHLMVSL